MSRPSTRLWRSINGRARNLKPQQVGLQIPRCLHSEVPKKDVVRSIAQYLGAVFRKLTEQKESQIEEGHLMLDHVHMMISIPPQYAVSQVIGFIKGKSVIHLRGCMARTG